MKFRMVAAALAAGLLLSACQTTEEVQAIVATTWVGHHVDEFFLAEGPPVDQFELSDGRIIYTWTSGVQNVAMPAYTTFGMFGAMTTGGGSIELECRAELVTNRSGVIIEVRFARDTAGLWRGSRCAEIFNTPRD